MISIIVPVYNCIDTLERCVRAICAQTEPDWELLLVNDGSKDGSGDLCDRLAAGDSRIRVFHKPNGGVSSARNLGLDNAAGEYVMFCDSDDWVDPTWCEALIWAAEANPDCLPVCNYFRSQPAGESVNCAAAYAALDAQIPKSDFFSLNRQELFGIPWNKIFQRSVLEKNGIRFRSDISLGEDLIFNLDYLHGISGGLVFVNLPLYHYSLGNPGSLSVKYYADLAGIYRTLYTRIAEEMHSIPGAWEKWQQEYHRSYFYALDRVFRNTWSKKNPVSLPEKYRRNRAVFHASPFQTCRPVILAGRMNALQRLGLKSNCFSVYWITVAVSERISRLLHRK